MTKIHNIQRLVERRKELRLLSTAQEALLWERLRRNNLKYKFRRQHSIGGYIADFYCAKTRLVIEIDGSSHEQKKQKEYDKIRDSFLSELNHTVLRFTNDEIDSDIDLVIRKISFTLNHLSPTPLLN